MATIELSGKVTTGPATDQEGLTVELYTSANWEAAGAATASTTTDSDGRWNFDAVAAGTYIVVVHNDDSSVKILFDGRNEVQFTNVDIRGTLNVQRVIPSAAFLAYNSAADDNVTGNGAEPTVDFDTEVFDEGGHFTADTFTPTVTGRYSLATAVKTSGGTGVLGTVQLKMNTSNRIYSTLWAYADENPTSMSLTIAIPAADMDANDSVTVTIRITGESSDVLDIAGEAAATTWFSGVLVS